MRPRTSIAPVVRRVTAERPSWPRGVHTAGRALALAALCAFVPGIGGAQPRAGTDCGCSATGPFVQSNPGRAPYVGADGSSAASNPRYHVEASPVPGDWVNVVRNDTGATVLQTSGLFWGFSPDQDRFLIWNGPPFRADLYDLTTAPAAFLRTFSGNFTDLRLRFSNDGRFILLAGLIFGGSQAQLDFWHAPTGELRVSTTFPINPTDSLTDDSDQAVAGWGFGPDSSRVMYTYLDNSGNHPPVVAMDNLDGSSHPLVVRITGLARWEFSRCGDVWGVVDQRAQNQTETLLWSTLDGASIGSSPFNDVASGVTLSTTAAQHQATSANLGTTVDLALNTAAQACPGPPTADFTYAGVLEAGRRITFTDASQAAAGAIASWSWSFGDGATSSQQNPTHVYSAGGTYSVTLTVTDGAGLTGTITRMLAVCSAPAPAGGKLLFRTETQTSSGNLFALNMDGSGLVQVTNNDSGVQQGGDANSADYSADGSRIAWVGANWNWYAGIEAGLSVSDADGSNRTLIVPYWSPYMTIVRPRWTPDGRSIAFYLRDVIGAATPRDGIYLVDADGSNMRLVYPTTGGVYAYPGAFSPVRVPSCIVGRDGCWVLAMEVNNLATRESRIYTIRGDGTGLAMLTNGPADRTPRFSPDGTKIAFERDQFIYLMDADGTRATPVSTHDPGVGDWHPVWSPDGNRIAFTRNYYPTASSILQRDVIVANADGCHATTAIVGSPFSSNVLSWSVGNALPGLGNIYGRVYFGPSITNPSAPGVSVTAFWNGGSSSAQTAADGSYQIAGIPIGVTITSITSTYPGYVWAGYAFTFPSFAGNAYGVYVGMQPDHWTLQGTVRDGSGQPVPGVTIEVSGQATPVPPATTGNDGTYSFTLPPNLLYTVRPVTVGYDYTPASAVAWGSYGSVVTQDFTATPSVPPTVTSTVPGGTYLSPQWVGLLADRPATIYYTIDGSTPTTSSPAYSTPILISGPTTLRFFGVDSRGGAGPISEVTYAFRSGAGIWAWGSNEAGQLGDGTVDPGLPSGMIPVRVTDLSGIAAAAGGANWSVAVKSDGTLWAWGNNAYGQLGDGTTTDSPTPIQVTGIGTVVAVAAGEGHTVALDGNGDVWTWGDNGWGQLGDGTTSSGRLSPGRVTDVSHVIAVAAGPFHTVAVDGAGNVWEWGNAPSSSTASPVHVTGLSSVTALAAGDGYTIARRRDGTVWAWGTNDYGQLGNGTSTSSSVPVQVVADGTGQPLQNAAAIAAGGRHSVALKSDGTVWAWGQNDVGQLGTGGFGGPIPQEVSLLTGAAGLGAGTSHTVALGSDGTVWAWGAWAANANGAVSTSSATPVQMAGLANVAAVAAGHNHSLAITGPPAAALLSYPTDPDYATGGLAPGRGTAQTVFTFKVVYTDPANQAPAYVDVCIDNACSAMSVDAGVADPGLNDGDFSNGEQYFFDTSLAAGPHAYRFEASDGANVVALPPSGDLAGPIVSDLALTSSVLPFAAQGAQYTTTLTASGGTGPYAWSVSGLPSGLAADPVTGVISGVPTSVGRYDVTASVTDANGDVCLAVLQLIVNLYTSAPAVQMFDVLDIGTLGGSWSDAKALNSAGQVAGSSATVLGDTHAFLYSNGVITDLGTLGGNYSVAGDLNSSGQVVGDATIANGDTHAFLYSGGSMRDLGTLGGRSSSAEAVNDAGQVVGRSATANSYETHAFLYSSGVMTDLGTLGGSFSVATAINATGQITGYSTTATGAYHAFLYTNGTMTDLGPIGGQSYGLAINDSGQITGYSRSGTGDYQAFLYANGALNPLGVPAGLDVSVGEAISGSGKVVGRSYTRSFNPYVHRAFLYDAATGMVDLGTLGGPWTCYGTVPAINNSGQVVGNSMTADGATHAFLYENGVMKQMSTVTPGWQSLTRAVAITDNGQIAGSGYFNGQAHAFVTVAAAGPPAGGTPLPGGGTMSITVPSSQSLSGVAIATSTAPPPPGVSFPFGAISYTVTLGPGETSSPATMTFTPPLSPRITLYKTDHAGGILGVIPVCNGTTVVEDCWTRQDTATSTTIVLTLTDNGPFDLNPAAGVIEDPVIIGFEIGNRPPIADAGPDKVVPYSTGVQVPLDGSGSRDLFNEPITYAWTVTSAPDGSAGTVLTGMRPFLVPGAPGTYVVSLVVNDGLLDSLADVITIRVVDPATLLTLSPVGINTSAGDQLDPHVDGDIVTYYEIVPFANRFGLWVRYYRFSTGVDTAIPNTLPDGSSADDRWGDVQGGRIAFTRVTFTTPIKGAIMLFDIATQGLVEVNPQADSYRFLPRIGGPTLTYVDQGIHRSGEIVVVDLANGNAVTRLTNDSLWDQRSAVSPDGRVVVWESCVSVSAMPSCGVHQAVKDAGGTWVVSGVSSPGGSTYPDTDGNYVVYHSNRGLSSDGDDVFYRAVSGGRETQLRLPGDQAFASIAGGVIVFPSYFRRTEPTASVASDLFLYEIATNRLFQITDTPTAYKRAGIDVTVLADGAVRVVWDQADQFSLGGDVYGATFHLTDLFLTAPLVPAGLYADGVHPDRGTASTPFTFKTVYTSRGNLAPWRSSMAVCIDNACHEMAPDTSAPAALQDGDYSNGEQYTYTTTLAPGTHGYYFTATDNVLWARLPVSGAFTGPVVSDLAITFVDCLPFDPRYGCTPHFVRVGGTAPFTLSTSGLPAGVTIDPVSGTLSGSFPPGTYTVTVWVTDATGDVASWTGTWTFADATPPVVTAPPDVTLIVPAGTLTPLSALGTATAASDTYGALTPVADPVGPFAPGVHVITWSATDPAGNMGTAVQQVTINTPSHVYGLRLPGGGGTVEISVPPPQTIANAALNPLPAGGTSLPGVLFSFGALSYTVTLAPGEVSASASITFRPPLAPDAGGGARLILYKADDAGVVLGVIPICDGTTVVTDCWTRLDTPTSTTIVLTLTDNGPFDLSGAWGVIRDPVIIAYIANRPPTATAGANQIVEATSPAGASVTLTGSGSDPDGDALAFAWSGPCGSASTAGATLTCPLGTSTMMLTVNDGHGGLVTASVQVIVRDTTPPGIVLNAPADGGTYVLNQLAASSFSCSDAGSGVTACNGTVADGAALDTASVGTKTFAVSATDSAGNTSSVTHTYRVIFASAGVCEGAAGHAILEPIGQDGAAVFRQGRTVPAKFRVCDANGSSIGTPGVVSSFKLIQIVSGTATQEANVDVPSTTPDTAFRWDPVERQWIFNISTKGLSAGRTYVFRAGLSDGTGIEFRFGLR